MAKHTERKVPGISDVARLAKVSVGTVSNVLNSPGRVTPSTLARVQDAIDMLGYVRNANARNLAHGSTGAIGLSLIDISNTLFVDIARGAQEAATEAGFNLLLANADNSFDLQDKNLDFFGGARVDGMLLTPMHDSHTSIERFRRHGRPVVVMNFKSKQNDTCTVLIDNEQVGYLAARHLIDLGRTRVVFIGGQDNLQPVHLRRLGALRAVAEESGRVRLEELPTSNLKEPGGQEAGLVLANRPQEDRPDGVIAVTDLIGSGVIEVLSQRGISVPDDVAVMGCDSNSAAWGGPVPLTTVQMRGYEMGRESIRLLVGEILNLSREHEHQTVMLEPALLVRQSTVGDRPWAGESRQK